MNVSNVSAGVGSYSSAVQSPWKQRAQDFRALASALQSGDLATAQQAFAALQKDTPAAATGATSGTGTTNPITQDFQALQTALQGNDVSAAQKAFTTLRQDLRSLYRNREANEGHDGDADDQKNAASGAAATTSATRQTASGQSPMAKDFQTLQSALQSGDLASAQQAFAAFQQDLQSLQKGHHHHPAPAAAAGSATAAPAPTAATAQATAVSGLNLLA